MQPAKFVRTTLPLQTDFGYGWEGDHYHSIWLPDHFVSFWPDAIWTPEFTDLAEQSPSPHRHLDALVVAGGLAMSTRRIPIATTVLDTVRRHPTMLAQGALTASHLSQGRFILGLGSGELENTRPYGFDFARPVSRLEEAITLIRALWSRDGPIDFDGQFFRLDQARLDTEPFEGTPPPIWIGGSGPRMLDMVGRLADGWWPAYAPTPEAYADQLATIRRSADRAGRDPDAIVAASTMSFLLGNEQELETIASTPLIKAWTLQLSADTLRKRGYDHPMGDQWKGFHDINPSELTRDRIVRLIAQVTPEMILDLFRHGTPADAAAILRDYGDAGLQVPAVLDYGALGGQQYATRSKAKVLEVERAIVDPGAGAAS
jgi:phthiodiolone/phenolphthiodiolone dimycocerosates ketoreductase